MRILDLTKIDNSDHLLKKFNPHFKIQNSLTPSFKLTFNLSKL
jgi:hypothetical protein